MPSPRTTLNAPPTATRSRWLPILLAVLAFAPLASAQDEARTQISENVDLARLVDLCAQRLTLNIQYEPSQLKGTLTLRLGAGVTDDELWSLTNRLLASRGFTTIQMPGEGTLTVVQLTKASDLARIEGEDLSSAVAGYVKVVREAQHADPKELVAAVKQVMSGTGSEAAVVGNTRSLLLADLRPHLEQAFALLALLDVPPGETVTEEVDVRFLDPEELISLADELSKARSAITGTTLAGKLLRSSDPDQILLVAPPAEVPLWRELLARLDRGEAYETRTYTSDQYELSEVAKLVEDVVRGGQEGGGERWRVVTDELTRTLFITARPSDHERIDALLARLEAVPPEQAVIDEIPVENVEPAALVTLVERVATTRSTVTGRTLRGKLLPAPAGEGVLLIAPRSEETFWRDVVARMDEREEVQTLSYTPRSYPIEEVSRLIEEIAREPRAEGSGDGWKLVADELTRTLILTATPSQHQKVAELLARLDEAAPSESRRVRAFTVRNRNAEELVDLLNRLVGVGALELDAPGPSAEGASQTTTRDVLPSTGEPPNAAASRTPAVLAASEDLDLAMTADPTTNTVIATGEVGLLDQLDELIASLDVRQPQVMLEVLVVNLSESDALDVGVELKGLSSDGTVGLASLFGLGAPPPDGALELPEGSGFSGVVLEPGDYSALLRALRVLNQGRTLNVPKVLVNSNEQAELDSVLQTPFTSTNASNTVATTSFGGTQDAGTSIRVRPQIAEGDHLLLDYSVSLSAFVGDSSDPSLPPPRQQNNLRSVATIPDGYAVALGGLDSMTETEATSQIPILGSIPWVGNLFKSRSTSAQSSRFYVFIRASVLRNETFADLRYLSERDLGAAGLGADWPVVEPRVIR